MNNNDFILKFIPKLIDIEGIDLLRTPFQRNKVLVYGEIHGIQENADVVYSLVHQLNIKQIALENSPDIAKFIDSASKGVYDFSLIDIDTFDMSILSLEMAKTIALLLGEGQIEHIEYIDTYFNTLNPSRMDHPTSPQDREQKLADNLLIMDRTIPTLCLLGQWHTQASPVTMNDGNIHYSALHRIRKTLPEIPLVHNAYGSGTAFNDGKILTLPSRQDVENTYCIKKISDRDFDLHIPIGHHSLLQR